MPHTQPASRSAATASSRPAPTSATMMWSSRTVARATANLSASSSRSLPPRTSVSAQARRQARDRFLRSDRLAGPPHSARSRKRSPAPTLRLAPMRRSSWLTPVCAAERSQSTRDDKSPTDWQPQYGSADDPKLARGPLPHPADESRVRVLRAVRAHLLLLPGEGRRRALLQPAAGVLRRGAGLRLRLPVRERALERAILPRREGPRGRLRPPAGDLPRHLRGGRDHVRGERGARRDALPRLADPARARPAARPGRALPHPLRDAALLRRRLRPGGQARRRHAGAHGCDVRVHAHRLAERGARRSRARRALRLVAQHPLGERGLLRRARGRAVAARPPRARRDRSRHRGQRRDRDPRPAGAAGDRLLLPDHQAAGRGGRTDPPARGAGVRSPSSRSSRATRAGSSTRRSRPGCSSATTAASSSGRR